MKSSEFGIKIANAYATLSKNHKSIADFILVNTDKVSHMSARELSSVLNISEATVSRFSRVIGYANYNDLKKDILQIVKNNMTTIQRIENSSDDENLFNEIIKSDISNIEIIYKTNFQALKKCSEVIKNSRNVCIIGGRSSGFLAGYLGFYLNYILPITIQIPDRYNDPKEQILKLSKKDVLICILFPRYTKSTIDAIHFAHKLGVPIILITDSKYVEFINLSTVALIVEISQISMIDSLVAPMELINLIILQLSNMLGVKTSVQFNDLETFWKEYSIYDEG